MTRSLAAETRRLISQLGLRARKSLGQHFLVDGRVLQRIVSAAELAPEDTVVEVGPGLGILTRELARRARRVITVEADRAMASALREIVGDMTNVEVVEADIMETDPASLLGGEGAGGEYPSYKVVANIPYYITSPILRHFLEGSARPSMLVVMVQKEVGEAITARSGKMSILAVSVQFYGEPAIVGRVSARSFYPAPKVDSVVLRIRVRGQPAVEVCDSGKFFAVVRAGFSAPRKQLRNSLAQGLGVSGQRSGEILERAGIDPRARAETLTLEDWARLTEEMIHDETGVRG